MMHTDTIDTGLVYFSDPVIVTVSGVLNSVNGVLFAGYQGYNVGAQEFTGSDPVILFKASDVVGVKRGDSIYINGEWYFVRNVEPDGTGAVMVTYSEINPDSLDTEINIDLGTFTGSIAGYLDGGSFSVTPGMYIDYGRF
jgi:hypothetical protein